jgi:hypothetical protein
MTSGPVNVTQAWQVSVPNRRSLPIPDAGPDCTHEPKGSGQEA